jgi:hypothetical protein
MSKTFSDLGKPWAYNGISSRPRGLSRLKMATRDRISADVYCMNDIHKVSVQIRAPRGSFPGEIAEGFYVVVDGAVVRSGRQAAR